jgi:hypothetical protein
LIIEIQKRLLFCKFTLKLTPIYIHVPDEKRTKFEPSNIKGIFVGYSKTSKAYWIYTLAQRKTLVNNDVKFDEDRWFSKSYKPPIEIVEGEKLVVPN